MRLFNKTPRECEVISFGYNPRKPEEGVDLFLGTGKDKELPGMSERDIARHHFEVTDLDWLIEHIQGIRNEFNVHND